MAHFHLAWELGGGLGHASRLKMIAQALLARGHQVSLGLRDLAQTHNVLADLDVAKFQAPVWLHRTEGMPPNQASLAEVLLTCGYLEPRGLAGQVEGWRSLYTQLKPDLVVADYSPTAILAARTMGIRSASVGIAFSSPPPRQPLPCLRDWENIPPQRLAKAEARVLKVANGVLAHHGAAPFSWAADLLLGDTQLLNTWPELDQYGRPPSPVAWLGPIYLPGAGVKPQWPAGEGPLVFAYLRTVDPNHAEVLAALAQEPCRVLCYLPEVAAGRAPPVMSPNIAYAGGPVSMRDALAVAQLFVTHAGDSTAQALMAGVPVMMLPMQLEQFLTARRIAAAGMGVNTAALPPPSDWRKAVRHMLSTPTYATAAQAFAARHAGYSAAKGAADAALVLEGLAA